MSPCEWNPNKNAPAAGDDGCRNDATVCVGADGQWHLCDECAELPRFARYRVRTPLNRRDQCHDS